MKKIIVYFKNTDAHKELSELLQSRGFITQFTTQENELLALISKQDFSQLFLYVQNLSDIRFLQTIQSLYPDLEINLIIPPSLEEIIKLLKYSDFKIVNDVMQIN